MVLENLCVNHTTFGRGVIAEVKGKYLTVKFAQTQKVFVYPDAFEKFLTCEDGTVPSEILTDLSAALEQKRKLADAKTAENRHAMDHGIVIPGKETVAESKDEDSSRSSVEDI